MEYSITSESCYITIRIILVPVYGNPMKDDWHTVTISACVMDCSNRKKAFINVV